MRPAWMPAPHDAPVQPYGGQPQLVVIRHHYAGQRRGQDTGQVLGRVAVGGSLAGVLLAVAGVAVAFGVASLVMAIMALVVPGLWRDVQRHG